jgi:putative transcriptional regulator
MLVSRGRNPSAGEIFTQLIQAKDLRNRVLITLGYSGWSAGQLEEEIGRNGWLTVDADPAVIFDTPVEQRYQRALSLLGFDPLMLSQEAGHA